MQTNIDHPEPPNATTRPAEPMALSPQDAPDTNPPAIPATPPETAIASPEPPSPPVPDEPPKTHPDRRRNGKVARLPKTLREIVNVILADGVSYLDIIQKLAKRGHHLNKDNLSRWHSGGYLDRQKEQLWLEEDRGRLEFASEVLEQGNADLLGETTLRIALTRMYTLLLSFDPVVLKHSISNSAGTYPRLLNALCKLTEGALKLHRHRTGEPARAFPRKSPLFQPAGPSPTIDAHPPKLP